MWGLAGERLMSFGQALSFIAWFPFSSPSTNRLMIQCAKLALCSCLPPPPATMDYFSLDLQAKINPLFPTCSFPGYFITITRKETNHSSYCVAEAESPKVLPVASRAACATWLSCWLTLPLRVLQEMVEIWVQGKGKLTSVSRWLDLARLLRWSSEQCIKLASREKLRCPRHLLDIHMIRMCRQLLKGAVFKGNNQIWYHKSISN